MSKSSMIKCFPVIYPEETKERYVHDNILSPNQINNKDHVIHEEIRQDSFEQLVECIEQLQDPNGEDLKCKLNDGDTVGFYLNPISEFVLVIRALDPEDLLYINVCSEQSIKKLFLDTRKQTNPVKECAWSIPAVLGAVRKDVDKNGQICTVHDVIFNTSALILAQASEEIMRKLHLTAVEVLIKNSGLKFDTNSIRKIDYKFNAKTKLIKYKIGEIPPQIGQDAVSEKSTIKLSIDYHVEQNTLTDGVSEKHDHNVETDTADPKSFITPKYQLSFDSKDSLCDSDDEWKVYSRKKQNKIPNEIHLAIELPLEVNDAHITTRLVEDGRYFEMISAQYYLRLGLPFQAKCEPTSIFDKDVRQLNVRIKTTSVKQWKNHESSVIENLNNLVKAEMETHSKEMKSEQKEEIQSEHNIESQDSVESSQFEKVPDWMNGAVVVKGILKQSERSRSKSESCVDEMTYNKEFFMSLENLDESDEVMSRESSSGLEKSVRFSESVERRLYRSNSSIFGQKKKNQRKSKNKKKARERAHSEGSTSSMDEGDTPTGVLVAKKCLKKSPSPSEDDNESEGEDNNGELD